MIAPVFLTDEDGSFLTDEDGSFLVLDTHAFWMRVPRVTQTLETTDA